MAGGKSRKTGGVSKALIDAIKRGRPGGGSKCCNTGTKSKGKAFNVVIPSDSETKQNNS